MQISDPSGSCLALLGGSKIRAARGACDFVQADVVRVDGITPYLEIAALARAFDVPLAPHFMMELSGQLLCCLPNPKIVKNIDRGSLTDLGALAEPIPIENGYFTPPDRPGILFDRATLAAHAGRLSPRRSPMSGRTLGQAWARGRRAADCQAVVLRPRSADQPDEGEDDPAGRDLDRQGQGLGQKMDEFKGCGHFHSTPPVAAHQRHPARCRGRAISSDINLVAITSSERRCGAGGARFKSGVVGRRSCTAGH